MENSHSKNRTGPRHRVTMLFGKHGNHLFTFFLINNITSFFARLWSITRKYSPKPSEKSYTSELVMKLVKRFEVGAYAISDRLTAGITGFLGGGVRRSSNTHISDSSANEPSTRYMVYQIW